MTSTAIVSTELTDIDSAGTIKNTVADVQGHELSARPPLNA
jgi:hypothetical protein